MYILSVPCSTGTYGEFQFVPFITVTFAVIVICSVSIGIVVGVVRSIFTCLPVVALLYCTISVSYTHLHSTAPIHLRDAMNKFLSDVDISFRRDKETNRPRVNKTDSYLDRQQKEQGEYYYLED